MRELEQTWLALTDPLEREVAARDCLDRGLALAGDPTWQSVVSALEAEIVDCLNDLARTSSNDEQNRGAIRALRHVQRMPENLIRAASAELDTHR